MEDIIDKELELLVETVSELREKYYVHYKSRSNPYADENRRDGHDKYTIHLTLIPKLEGKEVKEYCLGETNEQDFCVRLWELIMILRGL
jgi:hypothetical protein